MAGEITGKVGAQQYNIQEYFSLKKTNEELSSENSHLRSLLLANYQPADSSSILVIDSIRVDSILAYKRYNYLSAKVVNSFVSMQNNFLTIHRGSNQGLQKDWGVIGPKGIVGRVVDVSPNHAVVMSLLHRNFRVNCQLKNTGSNGSVYWDGVHPSYVFMKDIPKSDSIAKSDTVFTSQLSDIYPPGILVGTVDSIINDKSSGFYLLKLKTATNFYNVQYVTVIQDIQKEERNKLEQPFKKQ